MVPSSKQIILDELNKFVSESLNKDRSEDNYVRDGMDLSLCSIDYKTLSMKYSGANNPLYLVRNGDIQVIKADKFAIGSFDPGTQNYTSHEIQLEKLVQEENILLFSKCTEQNYLTGEDLQQFVVVSS